MSVNNTSLFLKRPCTNITGLFAFRKPTVDKIFFYNNVHDSNKETNCVMTSVSKITQFFIPIPFTLDGIPLEIKIELPTKRSQYQSINCSVPFPHFYPMTPFRTRVKEKHLKNVVATLLLTYDTEQHNLEIDIFYVYSAFADTKDLLLPGERLKGLGKYMLCKVIRWLIDFPWFSKDATASLTAAGNQCYEMLPYQQFTFDDCITMLLHYPMSLYYGVMHRHGAIILERIMKDIPDIQPSLPYDEIYNKYYDIIMSAVLTFAQDNKNDPELLVLLREVVCNIKTNQQLIERNYKPYGFVLIKDDGEQATMKGSVKNILESCSTASYGKKSKRNRSTRKKYKKYKKYTIL